MKRYISYFYGYKSAVAFGSLLIIIDVIGEIVQPLLMSTIVDRGIQHKDLHFITITGLLMVVLALVAIGSGTGNIWFSSKASVGFASQLRKGLFDKIQEFSFANIDRFNSASLVTRLTNDVTVLQQVIMMSLRMLIRGPLMLICGIFLASRINGQLTWIIAIVIPILVGAIWFILSKGLPAFTSMQRQIDRLSGRIQDNLTNIRVVKSFVREDFEVQKFGGENDALMTIAARASGIVVLIMPVMMLIMNGAIVAVLWFGGIKIMHGSLQVGQLISFITYITQILFSLMMLSLTIMMLSRAMASSKRILEVLNTDIDITDSQQAVLKNESVARGNVVFKNVCFKYHPTSEELALKDISFTVAPGETVGIIGPTGSGKTTLVQLIPRLYDVTSGQVLVGDRDVRDYTLHNLRDAVSMVLQKNVLFSGTIRENLKWGNENATDEELMTAAKDAQAHDFIMSFPNGYETVLGQGGVNVSGGQKQRLSIARALLKKPLILILDDSTSAIDTTTEAKIRAVFESKLPGVTIFIIAQRISSVRYADKILVMDNGALTGIGTHDELLKSNKVYQEIFYSQQQNESIPV